MKYKFMVVLAMIGSIGLLAMAQSTANQPSPHTPVEHKYFTSNRSDLKPPQDIRENYSNGNPKVIAYISNGDRDGLWQFFYENGKLERVGGMMDGKEEGWWQFFRVDGSIETEGFMTNGMREGLWRTYDEQRNFVSEVTYKNGNVVKTVQLNWPAGLVKESKVS